MSNIIKFPQPKPANWITDIQGGMTYQGYNQATITAVTAAMENDIKRFQSNFYKAPTIKYNPPHPLNQEEIEILTKAISAGINEYQQATRNNMREALISWAVVLAEHHHIHN